MPKFSFTCVVAVMFGTGMVLADGQTGLAGSPSARGLQSITPKPSIQGLVAAVSSDTITKYISQLSGQETQESLSGDARGRPPGDRLGR